MNGPIIDLSSDFGVKYDPDVLWFTLEWMEEEERDIVVRVCNRSALVTCVCACVCRGGWPSDKLRCVWTAP